MPCSTAFRRLFNEVSACFCAFNSIFIVAIKSLTEKGILNKGKPFATNTIYNILRNEKYTGINRREDGIFEFYATIMIFFNPYALVIIYFATTSVSACFCTYWLATITTHKFVSKQIYCLHTAFEEKLL